MKKLIISFAAMMLLIMVSCSKDSQLEAVQASPQESQTEAIAAMQTQSTSLCQACSSCSCCQNPENYDSYSFTFNVFDPLGEYKPPSEVYGYFEIEYIRPDGTRARTQKTSGYINCKPNTSVNWLGIGWWGEGVGYLFYIDNPNGVSDASQATWIYHDTQEPIQEPIVYNCEGIWIRKDTRLDGRPFHLTELYPDPV